MSIRQSALGGGNLKGDGEVSATEIEVLIVGSGVMGRGIARSFADAGIATGVLSRRPDAVSGLDPKVRIVGDLPD